MLTQHTPAPWKLSASTMLCSNKKRIVTDSNKFICRIEGMDFTRNEDTANARLIAAAPDLLHCLHELTEWACTHTSPRDANSPHDLLIASRAAIAKSTA